MAASKTYCLMRLSKSGSRQAVVTGARLVHAFRLRRSAVAITRIDQLIKIKRWDVWKRRAKAGDLQCYIRKSFIFGRILTCIFVSFSTSAFWAPVGCASAVKSFCLHFFDCPSALSSLVAHFAALCLCVKAVPFHDFTPLRFSAFLCVLCVKNLSAPIFPPALLLLPFGCGFAALRLVRSMSRNHYAICPRADSVAELLRCACVFFRKSLRLRTSRNIASIPTASTGARTATMEATVDAASSAVAIRGLPKPPVPIEETPRVATVVPCTIPATPPPAMIARAHLRNGLRSVTREAVMRVPAMIAAGVAIVSRRLSTQG